MALSDILSEFSATADHYTSWRDAGGRSYISYVYDEHYTYLRITLGWRETFIASGMRDMTSVNVVSLIFVPSIAEVFLSDMDVPHMSARLTVTCNVIEYQANASIDVHPTREGISVLRLKRDGAVIVDSADDVFKGLGGAVYLTVLLGEDYFKKLIT